METQRSIADWAEQTFGPAVYLARVGARANEEMAELLRKLTAAEIDLDGIAEEAADVVIVLYRLAHLTGRDLNAEVNAKMAINRAREWKMTGDGHGYHKRTAAGGK